MNIQQRNQSVPMGQLKAPQGPQPPQTPPPSPQSPDPKDGFDWEGLGHRAMVGLTCASVTAACSGMGAGFGWGGAAVTTLGAGAATYALTGSMSSGPREGTTFGMTVIAGGASAIGAAFGAPGVITASVAAGVLAFIKA